jgi:hypothetical protein
MWSSRFRKDHDLDGHLEDAHRHGNDLHQFLIIDFARSDLENL